MTNTHSHIKAVGLKVTLPRVKILNLLATQPSHHLSAEAIHQALQLAGDDIGLATVYRVLTQFEQAGLVLRHHFDTGQSLFELNRGQHHDHLICVECGTVVEFTDEVIEQRQVAIAAQHGFELQGHALVLYGSCIDCRRQQH
ncbi:ferric iron uptake transcriptional regulator [Thiospirillum jenense]|uniref:Ferric uptake regulation protein n=1 Tax=Thiospirillum jenense TaxID=1653858 RepID=A0A839HCQ2_9GAMM|nr:ferric iron uptake transcriptional regulator [Thiospirillum jenense]MBB1125920.1 ferric iron uptake transcriptional regulator [Thiospirillum jenense]